MNGFLSLLRGAYPWFWLAVALVCGVVEAMTLSLTTIWFSLSAFVLIFIAFLPLPFIAQLIVFVVLSMVLLIFTRPFVKKRLAEKKTATNYDRVIGKTAVVTKKICGLEKGTIKIDGMEWTAATRDASLLQEGSECVIEEISGVTAYVRPAGESK